MSMGRGRRDRIHFREEPRCHWSRELITYRRDPRTEEDDDGNPIPDCDVRARWTTDHRCTQRPPMIRSGAASRVSAKPVGAKNTVLAVYPASDQR
jgi:hypothetical protein